MPNTKLHLFLRKVSNVSGHTLKHSDRYTPDTLFVILTQCQFRAARIVRMEANPEESGKTKREEAARKTD